MKAASLKEARAAKAKMARVFRGSEVVNGVGVARHGSGYAVKLNLARATHTEKIPSSVDGVPVKVEVIGDIEKQSVSRRSRSASTRRKSA
jgi:hypothetical protein